MTKNISYHLMIGKGQGPTGIYRGVEDRQNLSQNLDDWVNTLLRNQLASQRLIDPRQYQRALEVRLERLYREAVDLAISMMGTAPGRGKSSVSFDLGAMGGDAVAGETNATFLGKAQSNFNTANTKGRMFSNTMLGKMLVDAKQGGTLKWQALTPMTIRTKSKRLQASGMKRQGDNIVTKANRIFVDSGSLQSTLKTQARSMVKRTGIVRVTGIDLRDSKGRFTSIQKSGIKKIPIGKLRVRLLPNVSNSSLPGLSNGLWTSDSGNVGFEAALGIAGDNLTKLQGVKRKRPLMQPVFTYYTLFRAPAIVAAEAQRLIAKLSSKGIKGS